MCGQLSVQLVQLAQLTTVGPETYTGAFGASCAIGAVCVVSAGDGLMWLMWDM